MPDDKALRFEDLQCFPHWDVTDAEALSQPVLLELASGGKHSREDLVADGLNDRGNCVADRGSTCL